MCGICGIVDPAGTPEKNRLRAEKMAESLRHRGPDAKGFWAREAVALGHARLNVIDFSGGRQPMLSRNGRYVVAFNGEIYNFRELRQASEAAGYAFNTASDTESLVALLETRGIEAVDSLEGMFAFAAYDNHEKRLHLAVDPFGKKPIYYYQSGPLFLFASEPKAILTHPDFSRRIDPEALALYLQFEYVPSPKTLFKGIRKMEAGTRMSLDASGRLETTVYHRFQWDPIDQPRETLEKGFEERFLKAVERRLVSDAPLGVFLSGGIDSSAVLWAVNHLRPGKKVKTFTIEFDDPSFDESRAARRVSDFFGTEAITEKCSSATMMERHEEILASLDEPLADASYIPTYLLSELTRKHVTVALSGDGGDEVFLGYPTFKAALLADKIAALPVFIKHTAESVVSRLPVSMNNLSFDFKAKQFFRGLAYEGRLRDQVWLGSFAPGELGELLSRDDRSEKVDAGDWLDRSRLPVPGDPLSRVQAFYYRYYLQGDILVKVDRASMAHSLEVRSPFLDDALVRFANNIPTSAKMKQGKLKAFLKNYLHGKLPQDILDRPKKGFGIPVAKWIRSDLRGIFEKRLSPAKLASDGIFEPSAVQDLFREHLEGRKDHRKKLWTLYAFQVWKEKWL